MSYNFESLSNYLRYNPSMSTSAADIYFEMNAPLIAARCAYIERYILKKGPETGDGVTRIQAILSQGSDQEKAHLITTILSSHCNEALSLISEEDINDYLAISDTNELQVRMERLFSYKDPKVKPPINIQQLFTRITDEAQQMWLVERILKSRRQNHISLLIPLNKLDWYLNTIDIMRTKIILTSGHAKVISLLTQEQWDTLEKQEPNYSLPVRTVQRMSLESIALTPPNIAKNTVEEHADKKTLQIPIMQKKLKLLKMRYANVQTEEEMASPPQTQNSNPHKSLANSSERLELFQNEFRISNPLQTGSVNTQITVPAATARTAPILSLRIPIRLFEQDKKKLEPSSELMPGEPSKKRIKH